MSEQPGRYQRSPSGLIGALLVLLLVIGAFLALRAFSRDNQATPVPTVDYRTEQAQARHDGLVAPAPEPMPHGWRATSVRHAAGSQKSWHLGMLTDRGKYVGIEEAQQQPRSMVDSFVGNDAAGTGTSVIGGRTWQTWKDPDGDVAITLPTKGGTILVDGSAGKAVIERLAAGLTLAAPAG